MKRDFCVKEMESAIARAHPENPIVGFVIFMKSPSAKVRKVVMAVDDFRWKQYENENTPLPLVDRMKGWEKAVSVARVRTVEEATELLYPRRVSS